MTRYFRLVNVITGETTGLFRERRDDAGLYLERFDPATGLWTSDVPALSGYIYNGEVGADEITREAALDLMVKLVPVAV